MDWPVEGTLHRYDEEHNLVAFESRPQEAQGSTRRGLIFVGGLTDGLGTVGYARPLIRQLAAQGYEFGLIEPLIQSSYIGWGTGDLSRDAHDIYRCVQYFAAPERNYDELLLMGHSTGCQDIMHLLTRERGRYELPAKLTRFVIQAPVSDREAIMDAYSRGCGPELLEESLQVARDWIKNGLGADVLPGKYTSRFIPAPISADRWVSLAGKGGQDDFFSSDLSDEELQLSFGSLPSSIHLLILMSANDDFTPARVDKSALMNRWIRLTPAGIISHASGLIPRADHQVHDPQARQAMSEMITAFLNET